MQELIDLGAHPPSNRYHSEAGDSSETHPIRLGFCLACGLGQLLDPMRPEMVRSRFDWITYNEPEGHLDKLVNILLQRLDTPGTSRILGVTYKDDSTLTRFANKGVAGTHRLNPDMDLGIAEPLASLETIQEALGPAAARGIVAHLGQCDLVLVRHILEHAHNPRHLLEACLALCRPNGIVAIEVPDCRKILDGNDHCFLWEEHISYFTPVTLRSFLQQAGFADVEIQAYPYPMEDSLIAIVTNRVSDTRPRDSDIRLERSRLESFAASFTLRGRQVRQHLQALQAEGQRVALFGAGHLATKFINFYRLAPYLVGVIDDNPQKLGRFMPGSGLPIISSHCLESGEVDICLLTLNPESEQKVRTAKAGYLERGGIFRSIFSASASSIYLDIGDASV